MSRRWNAPEDDEPEYESAFDGAEAKLYRAEWEAERMRIRVIDRFLDTLTHEDSQLNLFSYHERRIWNLRRNARR